MIKCKLNEYQYKLFKRMLNEDQESVSQKAAMDYLVDGGYFTEKKAEPFVRNRVRMIIRSLNGNKKAGKFTLGCVRILFDEDLLEDDDDTYKVPEDKITRNKINALNKIIKYISENEEIYKEFDRNLNNWSLAKLSNVYKDVHFTSNEVSDKQSGESEYTIYKIKDYNHATTFRDFVDWCITHSESSYNDYTNDGDYQFYFAVKKADLNTPRKKGENCPLDKYGLSMLAICVNDIGELETCTSRWNHDNGGNEHMLTIDEIEDVTNLNFYETFKPKEKEIGYKNIIDYVKDNINSLETVGDLREFGKNLEGTQFKYVTNYSKYGIFILVFRDYGYIYVDIDYSGDESYDSGVNDQHEIKKIKTCDIRRMPVADNKSIIYYSLDGKISICDRRGKDIENNELLTKLNRHKIYGLNKVFNLDSNDKEKQVSIIYEDNKAYDLSGETLIDAKKYVGKWEICEYTYPTSMVQPHAMFKGVPYILGINFADDKRKVYKVIYFDLRTKEPIHEIRDKQSYSSMPMCNILSEDITIIYFNDCAIYKDGETRKYENYLSTNINSSSLVNHKIIYNDKGLAHFYYVFAAYNDENDVTLILKNNIMRGETKYIEGVTLEEVESLSFDEYGRLQIIKSNGEPQLL